MKSRKTILLVEDESIIAMTEKMTLERYGYDVVIASTGEKAVELIDEKSVYDLILMDIDLGKGLDGTQAAERILSKHDIPVVFLSSHTEPEVVEKTEKITSYGYVVKNSSITVLDASIKMAFKLFDAKVNERKKEATLHENEEKYRLLHENAGIGIGYYSLDGIVLSYNRLAARNMNGEPEDFIGKSIHALFPKKEAEVYHDRIRKAAASRGADVYHDLVPLPSGDRYFLSTFTKIQDKKGILLGIQIISQDITDRKEAEESLRESKEKTELLLNVAAEIIISLDSRGEITLLNESGHRILGYDPPELVGKNWFDTCVPSEDRENIRNYFRSLLEGEYDLSVTHESDVVTKYGKRKTILWHNYILKNKEEKGIGLFSSGEDFTDHKIAKTALQDREEKYSAYVDNAPDGVFITDEKGRYIEVNKAAASSTGYSKDELLHMSFRDILAGESLETGTGAFRQLADAGSVKAEVLYKHKNGTKRWWSVDAVKINDTEAIAFTKDITDRKNAEQALKYSTWRLEGIIQGTNVGTWEWNVQTGETAFNEKWAEIIGQTLESLAPVSIKTWENHTHPDDFGEATALLERHFSGELPYYAHESRMKHKDGTWVWVLDKGKVITRTDDGKPLLMFGTHTDITVRKLNEEKVMTLLAEKELILKEVHHRIKNNMNAIHGLLVLQSQSLQDPAVKHALDDAGRRVKSMQFLYEQLYQTTGFTELPIAVYFIPLITEIVSNFPGNDRIRIKKHIDDFRLSAKILQPLGIILTELLTNIMKYAFTGRSEGEILVTATLEANLVIISIADDGSGMPDSVDIGKSTGFGLVLVDGLARQLGGTIRIERGQGTRIVLEFEK